VGFCIAGFPDCGNAKASDGESGKRRCPRSYVYRPAIMHIGHRIREVLAGQRRSAAWLAESICVTRTHIYKIFEKQTVDIDLLMRVSRATGHDFFADLSDELRGLSAD